MNPLYFGPGDRQLFGVYHPAAGGASGGRAAVICAPWGQEYVRAHRALRTLADQLARARWHVLRFDWYGAGDSAGERTEGEPEQWLRDLDAAVEEVRALADVRGVHLVGLRLGATLAAVSAGRRDDVKGLVLWDPVVDGRAWLDEARAGGAGEGASPGLPEGTLEVEGFPLLPGVRRWIEDLSPDTFGASPPRRALLVSTRPDPGHDRLRDHLDPRVRRLDVERLEAPAPWLEEHDFGAGPVPHEVLRRIASWRS